MELGGFFFPFWRPWVIDREGSGLVWSSPSLVFSSFFFLPSCCCRVDWEEDGGTLVSVGRWLEVFFSLTCGGFSLFFLWFMEWRESLPFAFPLLFRFLWFRWGEMEGWWRFEGGFWVLRFLTWCFFSSFAWSPGEDGFLLPVSFFASSSASWIYWSSLWIGVSWSLVRRF